MQLWLFLYAPNHGHSIPVSIGYLLLPIIAVILGKIVFNEYLSPLKWLSILFAALGVSINVFSSATISWATFVAGLGYPVYITLRRYFEINTLSTLLVELLIVLPFALYFIAQIDLPQITSLNPNLYFYLVLLGLINGIAIFLYITSSNLLPVNVFGLLGYVEPLMMLIISLIIGEKLNLSAYILMICLAISIALLTLESFKKSKHSI